MIKNKVANDLYAKTLEPGYDYEAAVNEGDLKRDLFNAIKLVMTSLEWIHRSHHQDERVDFCEWHQVPYAALDAATHIFKHGVVTTVALVVDEAIGDKNDRNDESTLGKRFAKAVQVAVQAA